ncbi:tRNA (adenosine(37)-N6)-threonylcarbamoyltransferase complex transferase subunit TsaD [Oceanivirga miroungae]|uniref:tRNA N6-adenosine threonylcarbamoyltransferase n=1 Tax=Oceanivirga miroungae TaxID=1130046 RepID=A0A6I8MBJ0_9FUSO|nr:tRNA (adenosine(37)-N6)-threonylcarbamoyltransferase complex transferase subunit TsaD [Oceanivirga miroungae]VWL85571.1 DNA-binding/iron metalloprotein/AP endonuclease [Oceanivirga miroungae]
MLILGIESSCDETSIAIVEDGKNVLSNVIATQIEIHKKYGGVVPEIASRHHIEDISYVLQEALEKANKKITDIDYIAVTNKPGLIGSLLVGIMFAKGLSFRYNIPLIPVNHLEGHIYSTFLHQDVKMPATVVVASGGHTSIYNMSENHELNLLGETQDDAIGEAYDKVARMVGLSYPGGPSIEKNSVGGENTLNIPIPNVSGYDLSFSGIKTFVTNYINKCNMKNEEYRINDICKSFEIAAVENLKRKIVKACLDTNSKTLAIAGGVSANKHLRNELYTSLELKDVEIKFPIKMEYCTDNGAMIAAAAYYNLEYKSDIEKTFDATSTKEFHRK